MAERTRPPNSALAKVARRVKSVDDIKPYVKVLAYGHNGSGKTRLCASAPKVLIIDINEEGTRSAAGSGTGAKYLEANTWKDVGDFYWYLKSGKHPYKTVALDTVTAMQNMAMSFVLGEAEERDPTRERSMPDKRSYGRAGELVKGMLLAYRNLPMHVIFTAQERTIKDEDTEEITDVTVDLPAGSRGVAMGCVGILGRMQPRQVRSVNRTTRKKTKKWVDTMVVGPHELIHTKDRTYNLAPVVVNPTMPMFIEAWQNVAS